VTSPRFAVIVPAYNAEAFLADCLDSIRGQTVADWEAIVVDDGSSDRTAELARSYADKDSRVRVFSKPNGGVSSARNAGFQQLSDSVRYVIHLDADDMLESDALEILHQELERQPDVVAVHGVARDFTDRDSLVDTPLEDAYGYYRLGYRDGRLVSWPPDRPTTFEVLAVWPVMANGSVLYRREAIADLKFDETLIISEDWDIWLRLAARGPVGFVPRFILRVRQHAKSATSNRRLMSDGERLVRTKWRGMSSWTAAQRKVLRVAHRRATLLRLDWSWKDVRHRRYRSAVSHILRFAHAYRVYVQVQRAL
jgi:glycosyltransferase involved in cell wall biosynthesis